MKRLDVEWVFPRVVQLTLQFDVKERENINNCFVESQGPHVVFHADFEEIGIIVM